MSLAASFAQSGFAKFINTPAGRAFRIIVGLALIGYGYTRRTETTGMVLMVLGLVPLAAGSFNWCLISALLGGPLRGSSMGPKA